MTTTMASGTNEARTGRLPSGRRTVFACDITSFGDPRRVNHIQRHLRGELYERLGRSFGAAGVPLDGCYVEDRGDGAVVVPPPEVPTAVLISPLTERLDAEFRRQHEVASDLAAIRLRVALHAGEVVHDGHGIVGKAVDHTFRLLDAPSFKSVVAAERPRVALIVSAVLHDEIVQHGEGLIDPAQYRRLAVSSKETETTGWYRLLGTGNGAEPAERAPAPRTGSEPAATPAAPDPAAWPGTEVPEGGFVEPGVRIPPRVLFAISEQLLDLPVMATEQQRSEVIGALREDIARTVRRQPDPRMDAYSLVRTCLDHHGGIEELLAVLRGFAGPTQSLGRLEKMVDELRRM
ncbi:hypothetical protein [Spirillospora sp. NPDC029432]|uniref:effector-associated domain 2-containing protein n=1 Tax=Spirillospora sp. NPDC029432 TaxID=3154599 RepID=UPI0034572C06